MFAWLVLLSALSVGGWWLMRGGVPPASGLAASPPGRSADEAGVADANAVTSLEALPDSAREAIEAALPHDAWERADPASLDALEALAREGHLAASHALGDRLLACRRSLRTLPAIAELSEASMREAGAGHQADVQQRLREQCQHVGDARADTGLAWLERAAAGGRLPARRAYAQALVELARDDAWRVSNPRLLRDGGARAEAWMRDAAERGDRDAIVWLGNQLAARSHGAILEADGRRSLAYQLAAGSRAGSGLDSFALGEGPAPTPAERAAIEAEAARLRALIRPRD
jgi:hypothetical protein